jgi:hypothetical protein
LLAQQQLNLTNNSGKNETLARQRFSVLSSTSADSCIHHRLLQYLQQFAKLHRNSYSDFVLMLKKTLPARKSLTADAKMTRIFSGCLWAALALLAVASSSAQTQMQEDKPIWLVVTRPMFSQTLEPLAKMRRQDGFETIISTQPVAETLATLKRQPAFLLLVGDYQPAQEMKA